MTTIQIKNKSNTFIFTKERLEKKAKEVSKPIYVYDKRTRGLCAYLGRNGITYSAHWSNTEIAQDGTKFSVGKRKRLQTLLHHLRKLKAFNA